MPPAASRHHHRLDERTRAVLAAARIDGTHLRLAEQLTRAEYTPVKQVLQALGGVWTPHVGALVFPEGTDVAALLADTLACGVVPQPARTTAGFVATPTHLAQALCGYPYHDLASLPAGARVLEPSAGTGVLVEAILAANPTVRITAVEPDPQRARTIEGHHHRVHVVGTSVQTYVARHAGAVSFDAAVMNPPFAVPYHPSAWIDHLSLVWTLLAPGARVVALLPASFAHRATSAHQRIRELVAEYGGHQLLGADAFAGTTSPVRTAVVWLTRPLTGGTRSQRCRIPTTPTTDAGTPQRVEEPQVSSVAARTTPVQIWYDTHRQRDRILRYRAQCVGCARLLWGFDDEENDPRGVLGDATVAFSLDPPPGAVADRVGMCSGCAHEEDRYRLARTRAEAIWAGTA